jgi:RHS repeat-associated protein
VRQLVDPTGQVVQGYSFSPFGVPLGESGGEPYGYTGEQWDASAGLVYLRARMYQPGTGRFLTSDPWFGDTLRPQTLNRYLYVTNNAVTLVDPSGLKLWRKSTSWVEQIIEEVYEAGQAHIHLEYSLPIGGWRPDILNSLTGEVFEIKPLVGGAFHCGG